MIRSFDGIAWRQIRNRRLRTLLTAAAVALGTGMVLGVLLLTGTIRHTFDDLIGSAWGTTDLVIAPSNNAGLMPDDLLARIRATPGVKSAAPMIGARVQRLDGHGRAIKGMQGSVMLAGYEPGLPPYDFRPVAGRFVRSGREVMVERNWARSKGLALGDRMAVMTDTGPARLPIVGIFEFSSGLSFGGMGLAAMPMDAARTLMDLPHGYLQVSVAARDRAQVGVLQRRLERVTGRGIDVQTPAAVSQDMKAQLNALDTVLLFFSGMALFVGGFLIFNSFTMTVAQRLRELGMLRTLGADRRQIARTVLIEAALVAVLGALGGIAFGIGTAAGLLALVRGLGVPVGGMHVAPASVALAVAAGVAATLAGAWLPARRAGRVSPIRATLGDATTMRRRPTWRRGAVSAALLLPGLVYGGQYWFGDKSDDGGLAAVLGIGGTMLMFAGIALAAPFVIGPIVRGLSVPLRRAFPTSGRLAADAAQANPLRTAATAAALTIGLSVVVVNLTMSHGFVRAIDAQMTGSLARDLTVRPAGVGLEAGGSPAVPKELSQAIAALPQAGVVTPVRAVLIRLPGLPRRATPGLAVGVDPAGYAQTDRSPVRGASREAAISGLQSGEVVIGRVYAKAAGLRAGGTLLLRGPSATRRVRIAAISEGLGEYFGREVKMSLSTMEGVYGVTSDAQLAITARSPAERAALAAAVQRLIDRRAPGMEELSTAELRDSLSAEVDQQFKLFNAIVAVAILVSLLGVVNTLAMSVLERTREIGLLRALGSGRWRVGATMVAESVLVTLSGGIAGVAIGTLVAASWMRGLDDVLPGVRFSFPGGAALAIVAIAVVLGALASVLPARRASRLDVVDALSAE